MENPYLPEMVKIRKVINETAEIKTLVLDRKMSFEPGQFIEVSVLNVGEAPFGISNDSDKHLEITVRNVGNVTNRLHKLRPGDKVGVRGPFGHGYPVKKMRNKNILLIAGGTGFVPVRGVAKFLEKNVGYCRDVRVFAGFRTPADILFKRDFEKWGKIFDVNITVDKPDRNWNGPVGVVTKLLENVCISSYNCVAVLCGPPVMIRFVIEALKKHNFKDDQIYVSLERLMHCGIMKCGHCMVGGKYVCRDGPVFRYDESQWLSDG